MVRLAGAVLGNSPGVRVQNAERKDNDAGGSRAPRYIPNTYMCVNYYIYTHAPSVLVYSYTYRYNECCASFASSCKGSRPSDARSEFSPRPRKTVGTGENEGGGEK